MPPFTERELAAARVWLEDLNRYAHLPRHLIKYCEIDHALWEAAAEGLYGKGWETTPSWSSQAVGSRVHALQSHMRGL